LLVSFDGGYEGDSYGRALIARDPHLLHLKIGWTVHPYGGHSTLLLSGEGNRSRVTEAHAATGQRVFVTEVGWPTAIGQLPTGDSLQWSEEQQAANIRSFVEWARGLGYVGAVVNFNYADYGLNDWYGIVNSTGTSCPTPRSPGCEPRAGCRDRARAGVGASARQAPAAVHGRARCERVLTPL